MKTTSVESVSVTTEMTAPWNEATLSTLLSTISWKTYLTQMSLACSTNVYHLKLTTYLEKSVLEVRTVK